MSMLDANFLLHQPQSPMNKQQQRKIRARFRKDMDQAFGYGSSDCGHNIDRAKWEGLTERLIAWLVYEALSEQPQQEEAAIQVRTFPTQP